MESCGKPKTAMEVDDARAQVMMEEYSNRLKGDFFKQYVSRPRK